MNVVALQNPATPHGSQAGKGGKEQLFEFVTARLYFI